MSSFLMNKYIKICQLLGNRIDVEIYISFYILFNCSIQHNIDELKKAFNKNTHQIVSKKRGTGCRNFIILTKKYKTLSLLNIKYSI